jgi:AraC-like DNA-binding protein
MRYAEHRPSPPLAGRVECFWFAEDPQTRAGSAERVLPDGCIEWIFHLGRPYLDASGRLQPTSFVAGPTTRPLTITPSGSVATLGVRFRPGGARGLLPPLSLFVDAFPTPREVWGAAAGSIEDEVAGAPDLEARAVVLERFLEKRREEARPPGARLAAAIRLILSSRGRVSISGVARHVGCSPRQLEREFAEGVGLSPKQLSRIARFQNVLRLAGKRPDAGWAELAARCGYADQAHLVRDFKAFSGATPTAREEARGALARHFIDPARLDALLNGSGGHVATPETPPVAFLQDGDPATA